MNFGELKSGGKAALARIISETEKAHHRGGDDPSLTALLDEAFANPRGRIVGLTGPPGVGKSTLTSALIGLWRKAGKTVGVIAVDPSSKKSGGALLGDRARIITDPGDDGVFIRSMAARDQLGGLSSLTHAAAILMRALYDRVIVETVGVGQSETGISTLADSVVFCVQPGSGDSLQFMKAGIVEIPHLAAVTKADLGAVADRARADIEGALGLASDGGAVRVLSVSARSGAGCEELIDAIDAHGSDLEDSGLLATNRQTQMSEWIADDLKSRFGREGLKRVQKELGDTLVDRPFSRASDLAARLKKHLKP